MAGTPLNTAPLTAGPLNTQQKAFRINMDRSVYGTFAEIGAGQEVARWFFQSGGAAGTVAKTISAYDMSVSDSIYGKSGRYVSRQRLEAMISFEYASLLTGLELKRGRETNFFVFADTVATRAYGRPGQGNGWLGVRFQTAPGMEPSQIIVHVSTHDSDRLREQEAIGITGVNLIYGAAYLHQSPDLLLDSLMDGLTRDRIEIDMVKFSGPAFVGIDNRIITLQLVEKQFTDAAMFTAEGEAVQPSEILYKRPVLIERGRFRPVTLVTQDVLLSAMKQFSAEPELEGEPPVVLMEMTLHDLQSPEGVDKQDFLARVDLLRALGHAVLISDDEPIYTLVEHLSRFSPKAIGLALGIPSMKRSMDEQLYVNLPGRALEAVGRLFAHNVRMYLYPALDLNTGELVTAQTLRVSPAQQYLYQHLLDNRYIEPIRDYNPNYLSIKAADVLRLLQSGDASWEASVPPAIAQVIKSNSLLGWKNPAS
jgi:hypothetical protein